MTPPGSRVEGGPEAVPHTLRTSRLDLTPLGPDCEAAYQRFYTDAAASAAYGGPLTPGAAWSRLAADIGSWQLQGFGVWAVHRRTADGRVGEVLGVCGFWQGLGWPRELTWWLLPEARGQGLALEASRAVVAHAYGAWGWPEVQTYTNDHNEPAKALVARLQGRVVRRQVFPDGLERNLYTLPRPAGPTA